jgi:hypothetical protein
MSDAKSDSERVADSESEPDAVGIAKPDLSAGSDPNGRV